MRGRRGGGWPSASRECRTRTVGRGRAGRAGPGRAGEVCGTGFRTEAVSESTGHTLSLDWGPGLPLAPGSFSHLALHPQTCCCSRNRRRGYQRVYEISEEARLVSVCVCVSKGICVPAWEGRGAMGPRGHPHPSSGSFPVLSSLPACLSASGALSLRWFWPRRGSSR